MNFDLDETQEMLRDMVARFVADHSAADQRRDPDVRADGFSRANWRLLAELGLLALPFSETAGGMGGGRVELITVLEQLGRGGCTEPYLSDLLLAGRLLERAGTPDQVAAWLPRIIAGDARLALAHAEHQARYNPLYVACKVRRVGGGAIISGTKTFVLGGAGADGFIVSAREGGRLDEATGLGLWLIPADTPGVDRRDYRLVDGSLACELRFHDVAATERLAGNADVLTEIFDEAGLGTCAELLGLMAALFDATLEHVRNRRQFGQPIGSFQAIQHRMAELYVRLEQSRSHLLRATLTDEAESRSLAIAGAKSFISENAMLLGEESIQLHGGMGVTDELWIGWYHKRIMVVSNLLGDADAELARYVRLAA